MRKNNYSKYEVLTLEDAGMHVEYSDQEHIDFVFEMEEENRQDVISLANEIAENVVSEYNKKANNEAIRSLAIGWFEKHKNDEDFAEELSKFCSYLSEMLETEANMKESKWLCK